MTRCESSWPENSIGDSSTNQQATSTTEMISASVKPYSQFGGPASKLHVCSRSMPDSSVRTALAIGNSVHLLYESGSLIQTLTFQNEVQQILWHTFSRTRNDSSIVRDAAFLCVVVGRSIHFHSAHSGYPHYLTYSVPFKIGRIYSTPIRLLVECESDESLLEELELDDDLTADLQLTPPKCLLYSLSHPIADLRAVIQKKEDKMGWDFLLSSLGGSERLSIVGVAAEYLLLHDGGKKQFVINKILDTCEETVGIQLRTGILHSTPLSQYNPLKFQQNAGGGPMSLSRSVLTRSLLKNTNAVTAMPSCLESFASPAFSHISRISHHSPISTGGGGGHSLLSNVDSWCSLRAVNSFSQLLDTPKRLHPTSFAELDPENVLLIAEVALDHCWTDTTTSRELNIKNEKKANTEAFYLFTSHLASHTYLNVFWPSSACLLVYDLPTGGNQASANVTTISCSNAVFIEKDERTLIVESDRQTLSLYAGPHKLTVVVLQMSSLDSSPLNPPQLFPFAKESAFLLTSSSEATNRAGNLMTLRLNIAHRNSLAWRLLTVIACALPPDKCQPFIASALHANSSAEASEKEHSHGQAIGDSEYALLSSVQFVLRQAGISIGQPASTHSSIAADSPASAESQTESGGEENSTQAKCRRPRESTEEKWTRLLTFASSSSSYSSAFCSFNPPSTRKSPSVSPRPSRYSPLFVPSTAGGQPLSLTLDASALLNDCLPTILTVMWNQLQEWYLSIPLHATIALIVPYLHVLASILRAEPYMNLLVRDFPRLANLTYRINYVGQSVSSPLHSTPMQPFSLWDTLATLLNSQIAIPHVSSSFESQKITSLLIVISVGLGRVSALTDVMNILGSQWAKRLGLTRQTTVTFSRILFNKNTSSQTKVNSLLRVFSWTPELISLLPVCLQLLLNALTKENLGKTHEEEGKQGKRRTHLTPIEWAAVSRIRWSDQRLANVDAMLQVTKPILLTQEQIKRCTRNSLSGEGEGTEVSLESMLASTSCRYLATPLAQAAFYLHTKMPSPMEALDYTRINYFGSALHSGMTRQANVPEPIKEWAEFNCGVAAALRIASSKIIQVPDEWIQMVQHKVSGPTAAGILCGLGLNGHFVRLNAYKVPDLLTMGDHKKLFGVGITLGYGGSYLGTADEKAYRVLLIELSMLMGTQHADVGTDGLVQCSAMAALGLLFTQTGHSFLAQRIVNEIARSPNGDEESHEERAAYKLCAGIALGLICLGKGDSAVRSACPFKESIPSIADRLVMMMKGGPRSLCTVSPIFLSASEFYPTAAAATMQPCTQPAVSNLVYEGPSVNVHMTSHPACLALALIYMQTNDERMARHVELPNTLTELEKIRPDVIWIRSLAKNLIMWNDIKPTREWVEKQVPQIVHDHMKASMKWTEASFANDCQAQMSAQEYAYWDYVVDRKTLAEVYLYGVAGACFAIGLKYSGMGIGIEDEEMNSIMDTLNFYLDICMPLGGSVLLERIHDFAREDVMSTCAEILLTTMAMIQAGNGDLETVRLARLMRTMEHFQRWAELGRAHNQQTFAHLAIAITFMSQGRCTFKRDKISLALLLIAFYPMVSQNLADNKLYHQPLRFLFSLAVEPRLLFVVSRSTSQVIACPIKITYRKTGRVQIAQTPCMLPPLDTISNLTIGGGRFETLSFDLSNEIRLRQLQRILTKEEGRVFVDGISEQRMFDEKLSVDLASLFSTFDSNENTDTRNDVEQERAQSIIEKGKDTDEEEELRMIKVQGDAVLTARLHSYLKDLSRYSSDLRGLASRDLCVAARVALSQYGDDRLAWRLRLQAAKLATEDRDS